MQLIEEKLRVPRNARGPIYRCNLGRCLSRLAPQKRAELIKEDYQEPYDDSKEESATTHHQTYVLEAI